jgi:hypothetical protein
VAILSNAQISPRAVAARENGRRGGLATAQKYGSFQTRAEQGGRTTRDRYGNDYFKHIRKVRRNSKDWPKGKPRKKIAVNFTVTPEQNIGLEAATR